VDRGHLAGNTTVVITRDGTAILHNKMNQPFQDAMQLIGTALVAASAADVADGITAADKVTDLGAQRAGVSREGIKAGVEKARIAADLEKVRILTPVQLPAP